MYTLSILPDPAHGTAVHCTCNAYNDDDDNYLITSNDDSRIAAVKHVCHFGKFIETK